MQQTEFVVRRYASAQNSTRTTRRRRSPSRPSTRSAPGSRRQLEAVAEQLPDELASVLSVENERATDLEIGEFLQRVENEEREEGIEGDTENTYGRSARRSTGRSTKPNGRTSDHSVPTSTIGCCSHASSRRARARNVISGVRIEWAVQRVDRPIASKCRLSGRDSSRRSRYDRQCPGHPCVDLVGEPSAGPENAFTGGGR